MAGSSTDAIGGPIYYDDDDDDPDLLSLRLARQLQADDDAAFAAQLMQEEEDAAAEVSHAQQSSARAATGPLPGEQLAGAAHKSVKHLGKNTCKAIAKKFSTPSPLSLRHLLQISTSTRREEMLAMVDAGQRERVAAELIALAIDLGFEAEYRE